MKTANASPTHLSAQGISAGLATRSSTGPASSSPASAVLQGGTLPPAAPLVDARPTERSPIDPRTRRWLLLLLGGAALGGLVWAGNRWEAQRLSTQQDIDLHPLYVLLKLGTAILIGLLVTAVQRSIGGDRTQTRSMEQAQTLLCLSGAMMMIIIGNSLARAFGVAGAAAIIRFRTPVEDPRDITILFLLMALGMAAGIGALPIAGLGALCVCLLLPVLDRFAEQPPRAMAVEFVARGAAFPSAHVHAVFGAHHVTYEAREIAHGDAARVKYRAWVDRSISLEMLSDELLQHDGIASVSWETKKG